MKLVILDRDGVINVDSDEYIKKPDEWQPIPGSIEAIARLTQSGWHAVIATNQSGIGRGLFDMVTLNAIHAKLHKVVNQAGGRIDAVFYCPDLPESGSPCRKPNPGMFHAIAQRFGVSLERVPAVGDKLIDLQAAQAVGARPMLVLTGAGERTLAAGGLPTETAVFTDLAAVAHELVQ